MSKNIPFEEYKPKNVSDEVWCAVVGAWEDGLPDRGAAFRASKETGRRVAPSDITEWKKNNKEVRELCEMIKDDLKSIAMTNVAKELRRGDKECKTSRWYLEHKCPEEFSTKSAVQFEGEVVSLSLEEKEAALKEMVAQYRNGRKQGA